MILPLTQGKKTGISLSLGFAAKAKIGVNMSSVFKNTPASIVKISDEARELSNKSITKSTEISLPVNRKGKLDNVLDHLQKVSIRIQLIDTQLAEETLTSDQKSVFLEEKNALSQEIERITKSEEFRKFQDTIAGIQNSLVAGASPQALQKLLQSDVSFIGSGIIGLVSYGNIDGLKQISSILDSLSNTSADGLNGDKISSFITQISAAKRLLNGPIKEEAATINSESKSEVQEIITPEAQAIQYVYNDNYALSLRGYSGKGLITAAAAGLDLKDNKISVLTISTPMDPEKDDNEDNEDKEEDETIKPSLRFQSERIDSQDQL